MKLIRRIQDRLRVNREDRENRRQDRKERRKDRINTFSGYAATFLFIISIIAVLIAIYKHFNTPIQKNSQSTTIVDAQAVKYGRTIISKINRVYDGDTFNVDIKDWPPIVGKAMPVRLNKIDTPEIISKDPALKSLAIKARDYVRMRILSGKVIELRNIQRDKYFRLDADLYIDEVDIAQELLKQGLAKPYDGGRKSPWE